MFITAILTNIIFHIFIYLNGLALHFGWSDGTRTRISRIMVLIDGFEPSSSYSMMFYIKLYQQSALQNRFATLQYNGTFGGIRTHVCQIKSLR